MCGSIRLVEGSEAICPWFTQLAALLTTVQRHRQARSARTEADMARRPIAAMLLIALLALPALGAQKTVLYEHFTASW